MNALLHPYVNDIEPYKPGKPVEDIQREFGLKKVIKLASNENCFPIPANVRKAMQDELKQVHLYPDSDNYYVRERIARFNGISMEEVAVGAGSVEIIRMIVRTWLKPGEKALTSEKTFSFYKIAVTEMGGRQAYIEAPMDGNLRFDLNQISNRLSKEIKIIFITNPNNPTGTIISGQAILDFIDSIPQNKIVVLDNAYQEYVDDLNDYLTGIPLALERKNVIVLRTFSKIYGLAGLRIGYAISHRETISALNRLKAPFNTTRISQCAAIASLESDTFKIKSAKHNRIHRQKLFRSLVEMGMNPVSSQTNFLLFFPGVDVAKLNLLLMKEGVVVRPVGSFGIPDGMRVTVGLEEENAFFLEKLKKTLALIHCKS